MAGSGLGKSGGFPARLGRYARRAATMVRPMNGAPRSEAAIGVPPPAPLPHSVHQLYRGYTEADLAIFDRFPPDPALRPMPGFVTNFLGVRTRTSFVRGAEAMDTVVLNLPVPDDGWHSDAVEWIGLLKSVAAARGRFTAMELGAGWGPWAVAGAVAARRLGIGDIRLCAIEADAGHCGFMDQHFRDNGLDPTAHRLVHAAVGTEPGLTRWPKVADPAADWGSRPLAEAAPGAVDHVGRAFAEWIDVQVVPFAGLLLGQPAWDLVHVDVQGWEFDLCAGAAALLDERVRWLVVATHDAKLHGDLVDLMFRRGWVLENEKPPRFGWRQGVPTLMAMTTQDGTQVWRNPALAA